MSDPRLNALSRRERQVLRALCTGCTMKAAARQLGISNRTVVAHMRHIAPKLGVDNKLKAILIAFGVEGTEPAI